MTTMRRHHFTTMTTADTDIKPVWLAQGTFANVYQHYHATLQCVVVIKCARFASQRRMQLLLPALNKKETHTVHTWWHREYAFLRRARIALGPLWGLGLYKSMCMPSPSNKRCTLVMEHIPFTWYTINTWLQKTHALRVRRAILMQACLILTRLHNADIVHGDIHACNLGIRPWPWFSSQRAPRIQIVWVCRVPVTQWPQTFLCDAPGVLKFLDYGCAVCLRNTTKTQARYARMHDYQRIERALDLAQHPSLLRWFRTWYRTIEKQRWQQHPVRVNMTLL